MLGPSPVIATDCARDTEGVDGATEVARDRDGVRGVDAMKELAREMDGVRGRSRSGGTGGARDQPNREVKMAASEGWVSDADDEAESSAGDQNGSSDMDGLGRATDDNAKRNELIWDEVWHASSIML